jgi:Uridylate kinase
MLKLSGEALMGDKEFGIDLNTINAITDQIIYVIEKRI